MTAAGLLVIDVGTTTMRVGEMSATGQLRSLITQQTPLQAPLPGLAELDAEQLYRQLLAACLDICEQAATAGRTIAGVGIANQRATAVAWNRRTAEPIAPALSWNDLRTTEECLALNADNISITPSESATKFAYLLDYASTSSQDLLLGTLDTWLIWRLSQGRSHVTDRSNAGLTGLLEPDGTAWSQDMLSRLNLSLQLLPQLVDSIGFTADASALPGAPPITAIIGDQQASLAGQSCVSPGQGKATFGTGAAVDICLGNQRVSFDRRGTHGSFPMVCWTQGGELTWGVEALDLAAGSNVKWLHEQLGVGDSPAAVETLASQCANSGGVVYVPALEGLGAPEWDFGARGTFLGLTRGTEQCHLARAVLEGVAHRGADLVRAAEADAGRSLPLVRIDGGLSQNRIFAQTLADDLERPVEIASETESTILGAGFLAGLGAGQLTELGADQLAGSEAGFWDSWEDLARLRPAAITFEPQQTFSREQWQDAITLARYWEADLSEISFW